MERPHTVQGLQAKRKALRLTMKGLVADIRAIDRAIGLFGEKRPKQRRGRLSRFVLAYIGRADGPVTLTAIFKAWQSQNAVEMTPKARISARKVIRHALARFEASGLVQVAGMLGGAKLWQSFGNA